MMKATLMWGFVELELNSGYNELGEAVLSGDARWIEEVEDVLAAKPVLGARGHYVMWPNLRPCDLDAILKRERRRLGVVEVSVDDAGPAAELEFEDAVD